MTTIMTPYFHNQSPYNIDIEQTNCRSCQTPTLFLDHSQGDTICTSCGLVHSQHYRSSIPEWRDYSAIDPDSIGRNGTARAGSFVDESRWAGGLEPTSLGKVYNPSASAGYNSENLQGYRRTLGKVKRKVDKWVEKDFERQVEEGKIALKIREKRKNAGIKNGDDYSEDFTDLGTNEHEDLARHRLEEMEVANKLLVSEKWSLDRALLLHGDSHEIPSQYASHNQLTGEQPRDVQHERELLNKRMDSSQRTASADLYCAYKIIQKALRKLELCENTTFNNEVMRIVCQYVHKKGSFKVKGVAPRMSNDFKDDAILHERESNYIKQRQMAALASAVIYMECKRNKLGRAVPEICSCFDLPSDCEIQPLKEEAFIKPKHLSRAVNEIKVHLSDYVKLLHESVKLPAQSSSSQTASTHREHSIVINQIEHITKKLKLSSIATKSVTKLVMHWKETKSFPDSAKHNALIASVIYMVCDAATTMQRLSKTALERKDKTENKKHTLGNGIKIKEEESKQTKQDLDILNSTTSKRKYIRPGGRLSEKKRRIEFENTLPSPDLSLSSSNFLLKSLDHEEDENRIENHETSIMQTYYQWSLEKSWYRSLQQIEASCNTSDLVICEFYRKELYPKRKELLNVLQESRSEFYSTNDGSVNYHSNDSKANILFANFSSVAPLMVSAKK